MGFDCDTYQSSIVCIWKKKKKQKQTLLGKPISLNHLRVIYACEKTVCQQKC